MSKLSKFKNSIPSIEAAALLSRLIGERVSIEELESMHANGWLTASYICMATIVRLRPMLDPEQHEIQVSHGRYYMEEDQECGFCVGYERPLDQVDIGPGQRAYVLRDEEGQYYALRDVHTGEYYGDSKEEIPYFEDARLWPHQIYELAEQANNDLPVEPPKNRVLKNHNCVSNITLYNFKPGEDRPVIQPVPIEISLAPEPPSFVLAVAALVEIATSGKAKKHNQSSLIEEILDSYDLRGLSKSNLEKIFSQANRRLTDARASKP
ncbi:hypothetical protein ACKUFS_20850 [Pseudomonas cannabina]|uniref:Uncharacterized protein n=3 Tax=Pseudomonas syringae group TaxID=136849 RepID=A0A8T8C8W1_PSEYM|nr:MULTISPECIES: hypothetical protein [Pseudomonas syringae group]MBM0141288.1 hypothetical protein [Pseudomonas cannabina pv. alisalensis]QHE99767.1 hypothetical protein PMA4326_026230 [Pseudomonas syringae pv. maculicola str. ES4326]QQN21804.1 hypothetical protein JGS08_25165 [Pseudomonas cannabina pv. alisalensis]RMN90565.1 hypothetical protein ALQ51_02126 [Pseudomonas cannabina]UBY95474.1 hypothetical protein LCG56_15645 [Pseudomonas cannabina pv. alisalensis]